MRPLVILTVAALLIAACGETPESSSDAGSSSTSSEFIEEEPVRENTTIDRSGSGDGAEEPGGDAAAGPDAEGDGSVQPPLEPGSLEALADQAVEDLSVRLGVSPEDITVVVAEHVVWRDGSHGCPQPGYSYTQALSNGARIKLGASGGEYWYHQGGNEPPQFCASPQEPYDGTGDA